jgi:hypothetical protein
MMCPTKIKIGQVVRYPDPPNQVPSHLDGYRNFFHLTDLSGEKRMIMNRGIDNPAWVSAPEGERRPAILIRSNPFKAGSETTPWHDVFDMDTGHVRYFGDHKVDTVGSLGSTRGNAALLDAFELHQANTEESRSLAVPLVLFHAVRRNGQSRGYLKFCGVGVLERVERVVQWAPGDGETFPNYVYDIAVLDLSAEDDEFDWAWINARRDPTIGIAETLKLAPASWRAWVKMGNKVLPNLRRRVARHVVHKVRDQRLQAGSLEAAALEQIYSYFDGKKHSFEYLAAEVAGRVIRGRGAEYQSGWITQASGDGGTDFVGRLDVGVGATSTKLVVLGQAKCVKPDSLVSADQVTRVVARLQRGWIGVFVTTGAYSEAAQMEILEDRYPIILINGRALVGQLREIANENDSGDLGACLHRIIVETQLKAAHRRPEEILQL